MTSDRRCCPKKKELPFAAHRKSDRFWRVAKPRKALKKQNAAAPLIGYMRVSKAHGSQVLDLQRDALLAAGVTERHLYSDTASGKKDDRPGLAACLQALRRGDILVVWKLDRLGRSLRHLVNIVHDLTSRSIGLRVLTGQGAAIDTTTPAGKLVFGIFASLAEFERDLISERTRAGLASARARGRKGGRRPKMTPAKLRLAMAAMGRPETNVGALCRELGVTRSTLYRHVSPTGEPRGMQRGSSRSVIQREE
jgi:DNA invertase Pin-like site-specific DNA recombinase